MKKYNILIVLLIVIKMFYSCEYSLDNNIGDIEEENLPPEIISLVAEETVIYSEGYTMIYCTAEDPEEDDISYDWEAESGMFGNTGPSVAKWYAPEVEEEIVFKITVTITDKINDKLSKDIYITVLPKEPETGTVTDYDGNTYKTVKIGNQEWMAENLKTTHYTDGTAITLVTDNTAWANLGDNNTDDAYCYYNNDVNSQYGALYTWAAAMNGAASSTANPSGVQGACPDGWHLPSDAEWQELVDFIEADGYSGQEGTVLKSTSGWNSDGNGTDIYGFNALPGGDRYPTTGSYNNVGYLVHLWSSSGNSTNAHGLSLTCISSDVGMFSSTMSSGRSMRCLKD